MSQARAELQRLALASAGGQRRGRNLVAREDKHGRCGNHGGGCGKRRGPPRASMRSMAGAGRRARAHVRLELFRRRLKFLRRAESWSHRTASRQHHRCPSSACLFSHSGRLLLPRARLHTAHTPPAHDECPSRPRSAGCYRVVLWQLVQLHRVYDRSRLPWPACPEIVLIFCRKEKLK